MKIMAQFISQVGMRSTRHFESKMRGILKRVLKDYPDATLQGAYNCGCSPDCGGFYRITVKGETVPLDKYFEKKSDK
jgi:hypothetical protein